MGTPAAPTPRIRLRPRWLAMPPAFQAGVSADSTTTRGRHPRSEQQKSSDRRKENEMKIVVIGGTGLIGSKLVERLREDGHDPLAASPDTGVNTITGEGLTEALDGAEVVVDVANAPLWDDAAVMDFFQTSSRNL